MKFLGEILRRKAPAPLATVPTVQEEQIEVQGELEVLQIEISMRQAQLDQLQQESAQLGLQLGEVAALRAQLLIRLSEGSSSASASIDTLDSETLALQRARDGLGLRMQDLERWIGLKQRRASELAHLRDDIRQDAAVAELAAQAESTTEEILASWRHSCELSFNLMNALDEALTANLDPEHKHKVLAISLRVATAMQRASLAFVNENWQFARADSFQQSDDSARPTARPGCSGRESWMKFRRADIHSGAATAEQTASGAVIQQRILLAVSGPGLGKSRGATGGSSGHGDTGIPAHSDRESLHRVERLGSAWLEGAHNPPV